jgi:hypothetical protein
MFTAKTSSIACSTLGVCVAGVGAFIAVRAVVIIEEQATMLSETRWNGNADLKASLLRQSRSAKLGLLLILLGTVLQIVGTVVGGLS